MIIDDNSVSNTEPGNLTETRLTGLGMGDDVEIEGELHPGGITYTNIEVLDIGLGSGGTEFTIETTHPGATVLRGNDGPDVFNVRTIAGHTTIDTGSGTDTVNAGTLAPGSGGIIDTIGALLTVAGGGEADVLNVDDRGDANDNVGVLTRTTLTDLDMPVFNEIVDCILENRSFVTSADACMHDAMA